MTENPAAQVSPPTTPLLEAEKERVRLKKSNLRRIARRSGKTVEELTKLLDFYEATGRRCVVTYDVIPTARKREKRRR